MSKRIIITESEKNNIKKLYGLNEESDTNMLFFDILKRALESNKKGGDYDKFDLERDVKSLEKPENEKNNIPDANYKSKIKHNYTGDAGKMVNYVIQEMEKMGITNPYTQIGILSVIAKESGFTAVKEYGYGNTSDARIVKIFGKRGQKCKHLKNDDAKFFDCVYGKDSGMPLGNTSPGDGWKYVGRGLNGITGRANYRKYGNLIGVDLEGNPELLEKPEVSAKAAIAFFLKGKDPKTLPDFKDEIESSNYFADLNAGGVKSDWSRDKAVATLGRFDISTDSYLA